MSLKGCSKTLKRFRPFVSERRIVHNVTERNDESSIGVGKPGERTIHSMHMHALPFPSVCVCVCVCARRFESANRPTVFRATAPTKSGIFPISRLLMRLDVRMSNLFYWMYTRTVPRQPISRASIRFVPSRESTYSNVFHPFRWIYDSRITSFWYHLPQWENLSICFMIRTKIVRLYIFFFDKLIDVIKKERKQKNKFDYFRVFLKCFIRLLICNYL